jgi:hypothetical protein
MLREYLYYAVQKTCAVQVRALTLLKVKTRYETKMRRPGIEPGPTAWKAAMLTTIPPTLVLNSLIIKIHSNQ